MISSVTNLAAVHKGFVDEMSKQRHQIPIEWIYTTPENFRESLDDLESRLLDSATDSATIVIKLESGEPVFSTATAEEMIDVFAIAGQSKLHIHLFV
jgi:hypothetical protein